MPVQVKRLLIAFGLFFALMFALKYFLTPESWGEFGPYRGKALIEIAEKEARYIDMEDCVMCHDSIGTLKLGGEHKLVNCQTCHGFGYKHIEDPEVNKMEIGEGREFCVTCHEKNPARPESIIRQIDAIEHNKGEVCITCHNPHQPWL